MGRFYWASSRANGARLLPALGRGLVWDVSSLYETGVIRVLWPGTLLLVR
jgi:hypothetical protein